MILLFFKLKLRNLKLHWQNWQPQRACNVWHCTLNFLTILVHPAWSGLTVWEHFIHPFIRYLYLLIPINCHGDLLEPNPALFGQNAGIHPGHVWTQLCPQNISVMAQMCDLENIPSLDSNQIRCKPWCNLLLIVYVISLQTELNWTELKPSLPCLPWFI